MENPLVPTGADVAFLALTVVLAVLIIAVVGILLRVRFLTTAGLRARDAFRRIAGRSRG